MFYITLEAKTALTQHVILVGFEALIKQEIVRLESIWEEHIPLWHEPFQSGPRLVTVPIIAAAAVFTAVAPSGLIFGQIRWGEREGHHQHWEKSITDASIQYADAFINFRCF